jgi:hypothetical protein
MKMKYIITALLASILVMDTAQAGLFGRRKAKKTTAEHQKPAGQTQTAPAQAPVKK